MKISELLIEAIIKTDQGPIIRAQNRSQLERTLILSKWRELRAIILPKQIWFTDSWNMVHYEMARALKEHTPLDLTDGIGVIIRDERGVDHLETREPILGPLIISSADYKLDNYHKLKNYPIVKRYDFTVLDKPEL